MKLYATLRKPANLREIFSACKHFKVKKLTLFVDHSNKYDFKKYIMSFDARYIDFKINFKKYKKKLPKIFFKNEPKKYISIQLDHTLGRIKSNLYFKNIKIGITDGLIHTYSKFFYYIAVQENIFLKFIKFPIFLLLSFIKLDIVFSDFYKQKILFTNKKKKIEKFCLKKKLINLLKKNKINILICPDSPRTLNEKEIVEKFSLIKLNFCSVKRNGDIFLNNKYVKNYKLTAEMIIDTGLIKKIYVNQLSTIYKYSKIKNIEIVKLPIKLFHLSSPSFFNEFYLK